MPSKPSLQLLRSLSDERVLRAVMEGGRRTRAELAALTGLSKPTVSESVRRLSGAGLLHDTGERTTGRGRAGSYYSLSDECGHALVVRITPASVRADAVNAFGDVVGSGEEVLAREGAPDRVSAALTCVVTRVTARLSGPLRCAAVSVADPVDRETGRLVHLPDLPFLVGDLDPVSALGAVLEGPVLVDNDVNWAARSELTTGVISGVGDALLLHLGEGLGSAVVTDGEVRRGGHGLAGEIAHILTRAPDGSAMPFIEVFAELDLRRHGSTGIDVELLLQRVRAGEPAADHLVMTLATAVTGVISAAVGLTDPRVVVLSGSWGADPGIVAAVTAECARSPRPVELRAAVGEDPEMSGVRRHAVEELRRLVVATRHAAAEPHALDPT